MEREGENGGEKEAGAHMDSQRPLGPEAFFTDGETEAKGQRLDTESAGGGSVLTRIHSLAPPWERREKGRVPSLV